MERFFSSLKTEGIGRQTYRTRNHAKADVFGYIEQFHDPTRQHSPLGHLSPVDFEAAAGQFGCSSIAPGSRYTKTEHAIEQDHPKLLKRRKNWFEGQPDRSQTVGLHRPNMGA